MAEPNQIDITLSLLGQKQGQAFQEFIEQLRGLNASMHAMRSVTSADTASANASLKGSWSYGSRATESGPMVTPEDHSSSGEKTLAKHAERTTLYDSAAKWAGGKWASSGDKRTAQDVDNLFTTITGKTPRKIDPDAMTPMQVFKGRGDDKGVTPADRIRRASEYMDGRTGGLKGMVTSAINNPIVSNWYLAHQLNKRNAGETNAEQTSSAGWGRENLFDTSTMGGQLGLLGGQNFGMLIPGAGLMTKAGQQGITERGKDFFKSFAPGFSRGDSKDIREQLYGRGWVNGDTRDRMYEGLKELKQRQPGLDVGLNAEAIDQATRYGTTSVKDFVTTLSGVSDAAHAAGVNFKDLQQQVIEVGNATQKMGGTFAQGATFAIHAASITGMDPRIQQGLSENPFVQARGMATTGLLPQQQGLLSAGARTALNYDAAHSVVKMYSGYKTTSKTDEWGGTETITGTDKGLAAASAQLGIPIDVLKKMERDRPRVAALSHLETMATQQKKQAASKTFHGDEAGAKKLLNDKTSRRDDGVTTWGDMEAMMRDQKDADGKAIFGEKEIASVRDAGRTDIKRKGKPDEHITAKSAANRRIKEFERISNKATDKENQETAGAEVTIGFTDDAKRLLKVEDEDYGQRIKKNRANNGHKTIINAESQKDPRFQGAGLLKRKIAGG